MRGDDVRDGSESATRTHGGGGTARLAGCEAGAMGGPGCQGVPAGQVCRTRDWVWGELGEMPLAHSGWVPGFSACATGWRIGTRVRKGSHSLTAFWSARGWIPPRSRRSGCRGLDVGEPLAAGCWFATQQCAARNGRVRGSGYKTGGLQRSPLNMVESWRAAWESL